MSREELRQLLNWMMVSDPWPDGVNRVVIENLLHHQAKIFGFGSWLDAYHHLEEPKETDVSKAAREGYETLHTDKQL